MKREKITKIVDEVEKIATMTEKELDKEINQSKRWKTARGGKHGKRNSD